MEGRCMIEQEERSEEIGGHGDIHGGVEIKDLRVMIAPVILLVFS